AIRVRCWPTNRIRGFGQLGKGHLHMGRSGSSHGYCSGGGEMHRKGWFSGSQFDTTGYDVLSLFPSWSLVSAGTNTPYLLDGYGVLRKWSFDSSESWIRRIVMENPNHLNEPNEAIPKVNLVVPELNQVADIHDPNEMVDIPDDIDLVDYEEEDPKEDPEEEPEEDVDIELEDDDELIFTYEVEGDKTPPPGDVSSDSVSFESDSKDEEVDV
nr:hypothetical protein [Tanacetum cinerariifolium]